MFCLVVNLIKFTYLQNKFKNSDFQINTKIKSTWIQYSNSLKVI
jgi:hypothetical protein